MRLIDADALVKAFDDYVIMLHPVDIIEEINDAPTVDTVKHGHWILKKRFSPFIHKYISEGICSICSYNSGQEFARTMYDYCYKCGAKMDEEVSE